MITEILTRMRRHYSLQDCQIGIARVPIQALRCDHCRCDFHIDREPKFCPECGFSVTSITNFGEQSA